MRDWFYLKACLIFENRRDLNFELDCNCSEHFFCLFDRPIDKASIYIIVLSQYCSSELRCNIFLWALALKNKDHRNNIFCEHCEIEEIETKRNIGRNHFTCNRQAIKSEEKRILSRQDVFTLLCIFADEKANELQLLIWKL